jgi:hypothetical protein
MARLVRVVVMSASRVSVMVDKAEGQANGVASQWQLGDFERDP